MPYCMYKYMLLRLGIRLGELELLMYYYRIKDRIGQENKIKRIYIFLMLYAFLCDISYVQCVRRVCLNGLG